MRSFVLLVLAVLYFFNNGMAQAGNDSAAIAEARAAFKMISQKPDSALAIAERLLLLSERSGDKKLAAFAYKARGWAFRHKGFYGKCFPDLLLSIQLFHQLHEAREELMMDINLSLAYSNHSEFLNSARYLIIADSLAQKLNDQKERAEIQRLMGILYREQEQYPKAIHYFRESMDMYRSIRDSIGFFGAAASLSILYMSMSLPDSSLAILKECAPLINTLQGANYEKSMLNERFGDAYYATSRYDKALESYGRAYKTFDADNNKADMAYEAMNLGKTFTRLKKYRDAENYLLLGYRIDDSLKMINYIPDVSNQLANLYQATGDWRKAYHWLEKRDSLQDSLQLAAQNDKTAQLQAQYEADKREKEISLLKKDRELNHAVVQRQKVFQRGAVVVVFLLVLIGILIINRYRTVQRARRLLELEKMRNNIARDLHDDMGSALSSINIISKVALAATGEEQKVSEHLKKIHDHSGLILENMSDIVWTINPGNDTLEKIIFKMREFAADILDPLNIEYVFNLEGDLQDIELGLQTRKDLYLIFKEAVNNAAKYSGCTKIDITITTHNRRVGVQIKDNGAGFSRNAVKGGNGLKNMEERAGRMNGDLTISSTQGQGTTVTLHIRSHD